MTREEFNEAWAKAFPSIPGEEAICRAVDQRQSDQWVYDQMVTPREPQMYWTASVIVRPQWDLVAKS